jgi:hypothetical protein
MAAEIGGVEGDPPAAQQGVERPTSLTVIGWLAVGLGSLGVLGGLMGLAVSLLVPEMHDVGTQDTADIPAPVGIMSDVFPYFWVLATVQLLAAALLIVAGIGLLRLKAWARTAIEVLAWLGLAYNLGFGVFWLWSLAAMSEGMPKDAGPAAVVPTMMVSGIVMIVAFSVPLVIVIRVLRGTNVREAIAAAIPGTRTTS